MAAEAELLEFFQNVNISALDKMKQQLIYISFLLFSNVWNELVGWTRIPEDQA